LEHAAQATGQIGPGESGSGEGQRARRLGTGGYRHFVELTGFAGIPDLTGFAGVTGVAGLPRVAGVAPVSGISGSAHQPEALTDRKP
jgi:hypothetical protein